jgi:hypothetical protein
VGVKKEALVTPNSKNKNLFGARPNAADIPKPFVVPYLGSKTGSRYMPEMVK